MKLVITMSRRFGTGASIIAEELSKRLDIPVYDKAYIEEKLSDHKYESEKHLCECCQRGPHSENHEKRKS